MRVVIDTNVIVSGLNFPGQERQVLELARAHRYELYLSRFILEETAQVLQRKFRWSERRVGAALQIIAEWATVVDPSEHIDLIRRKDSDNRILECAVEAKADYLVTGDKRDILPLGKIRGTRIVTSSQFLSVVEGS